MCHWPRSCQQRKLFCILVVGDRKSQHPPKCCNCSNHTKTLVRLVADNPPPSTPTPVPAVPTRFDAIATYDAERGFSGAFPLLPSHHSRPSCHSLTPQFTHAYTAQLSMRDFRSCQYMFSWLEGARSGLGMGTACLVIQYRDGILISCWFGNMAWTE